MNAKRDPEVVEAEVVDEKRERAPGERPLEILGIRLRPEDERRLREIGGAAIGAVHGAQAIGNLFKTLGQGKASSRSSSADEDGSGASGAAQTPSGPNRRRPMPGERARARRGT